MRKIKNSKGFTLMEMLIVVAIIAVLVAIAIPTFNNSLNKAELAVDQANIRTGYASYTNKYLLDEITEDTTYYLQKDGSVAATGTNDYECTAEGNISIAGQEIKIAEGSKIVYKFENEQVKVEVKAKSGS